MTPDSTIETSPPTGVPVFGLNLHEDDVLVDLLPVYDQIRDAGPLVWMSHYGYYACAGYQEVSDILSDWETFSSKEGVGFNPVCNAIKETSLQTEGAQHDQIRRIEGRPFKPEALDDLTPRLRGLAEDLVTRLKQLDRIDGVNDIAKVLPLDIVTDLVGVEGLSREQLFNYGVAGFDSFGPMDAHRTMPALQTMAEYVDYSIDSFPSRVREGGWADQLFTNGREAGWSEEYCRGIMNDYIYPSLDSTVSSISTGLLLFGQNPEQWDKLRNDRSLLSSAIPEIVRLASPLQFFTRLVTKDAVVSGVALPKGARVIVMYAAANRDGRKFPNANSFDITRPPLPQMGWGRGKHSCLGKPLARKEMMTLFDVLADHVERFDIGKYSYQPNNLIRSLGELELAITWSDQ